jgi:hypothetical protein
MLSHCVNAFKVVTHESVILKIPFYVVPLQQWTVARWKNENGSLVIEMVKTTALHTALPTAQPDNTHKQIEEAYKFARYPGELR